MTRRLLTLSLSQNGVDDMLEQFYESQENRLRILAALHSKDLPIDVSHFSSLFSICCIDFISARPPFCNARLPSSAAIAPPYFGRSCFLHPCHFADLSRPGPRRPI